MSGRGLSKSKSKGNLKWDEANLDENEKIKSGLPSVKVSELKAPLSDGGVAITEPTLLEGVPAGATHDHVDVARRKLLAKEALAASRRKIEEELKAEDGSGS